MSAIVPALVMGVSLFGSVASAASQRQAGNAAAAAGEYNAAVERQNALAREQATQQETVKMSREARVMAGAQTAAYGASGLSMEGTPLEVMANTARNYERDILLKSYTGEVGAVQDINQAAIDEWSGKQKKKAADWQATGTLLTGLGRTGELTYDKGWFK